MLPLHFLQILTFFFLFLLFAVILIYLYSTLVGLPHSGQTSIVLEIFIGAGNSILWPFSPFLLARICLINKFKPSMLALFKKGKTCKTFPVLPLSFPANIFTLSFFLIFIGCDANPLINANPQIANTINIRN